MVRFDDIAREALEALSGAENPSARACLDDFWAQKELGNNANAVNWLLTAAEHEVGMFHPLAERLARWVAASSHPLAKRVEHTYGLTKEEA